jgi:hypothetical protein
MAPRIGEGTALMSYFDPATWRTFSAEERNAFFKDLQDRNGKGKQRKKKRRKRSNLVLQETVSPFDAYAYLHARFGPPNGLQTLLAKDDSDNLFHWDYYLKAGDQDLKFVGASEEVHVWFDVDVSDKECVEFIAALRRDFGRVGKEKGRFAAGLEKWSIFPNQYLSIASRCADLYYEIDTAIPKIERKILADKLTTQALMAEKRRKSHSKLMSAVTTAPTELSVLMPVLFESFIGLIVAVLIKPEVRRDTDAFAAFVRSALNQKLVDLAERCNGFARPIVQNNPAFGRYWTVVNKRNDVIHGNVDPVRDCLEVVYFHGKRPLYKAGGDRLRQHWLRLIDRYRPQDVLDDYIATQAFILEILDHMTPDGRRLIETVMEDTQPGWDNRRKIVGRLFPDHVATTVFDAMRYDWQLDRV